MDPCTGAICCVTAPFAIVWVLLAMRAAARNGQHWG